MLGVPVGSPRFCAEYVQGKLPVFLRRLAAISLVSGIPLGSMVVPPSFRLSLVWLVPLGLVPRACYVPWVGVRWHLFVETIRLPGLSPLIASIGLGCFGRSCWRVGITSCMRLLVCPRRNSRSALPLPWMMCCPLLTLLLRQSLQGRMIFGIRS